MPNIRIVVQKYGGSSVSDLERLRKVAARVVAAKEAGHHPVVVVSAMGKTTDDLLELARAISKSPSRRELDLLLSVGERISMTLLAMAIQELGHEAESFTGSQSGIVTDESHIAARIIEVRPHRLVEALERDRIVIVAGYQGVSRNKNVTTLGRGGSDTTAVALAAALGAVRCEICSDVDGIYSADPRNVKGTRRIDTLSACEVVELGIAGASVLAASAADEARRRGVEIHAVHSTRATGGTVVTTEPAPGVGRAKAVSWDPHQIRVLWEGAEGEEASLLEALEPLDIALRSVRDYGPGLLEFWIDTRDLHDQAAFKAVLKSAPGKAKVGDGFVRVTAVGTGIAECPAMVRKARVALQSAGIDVRGLSSSPNGLCVVVERAEGAAACAVLHQVLVVDGQERALAGPA